MGATSDPMTLTHYIGGKLSGLTVDFPPSLNYPQFTTFINQETFIEYILVAGVWEQVGVPPPTWDIDDDFTSYNSQVEADAVWIPENTSVDVDIANDRLELVRAGNNLTNYRDLTLVAGTISDTNWVIRHNLEYSALAVGLGAYSGFCLSDIANQHWTTSIAGLGTRNAMHISSAALRTFGVWGYDTGNFDTSDNIINLGGYSPTTGVKYPMEYVRESATSQTTTKYDNDSDFTTGTDSQTQTATIPSSLSGGRYFASVGINIVGGNITQNIDHFWFANGVSVAP